MANPKAIINKKYAPKEIQSEIIRAEKLNDYLLNAMKTSEYVVLKEETAFKLANYFNDKHSPIVFDYKSKFGLTERNFVKEPTESNSNIQDKSTSDVSPYKDDDAIREQLKAYRLETSRKENIKPYFVFNNEQMEELIKFKPKTKDELIKIRGFGNVKTEKYGEKIITLLQQFGCKHI